MRSATLTVCLLLALPAAAQPIQRSPAEVRAFRAENPCPATGRRSGPCKGFAVDHVRPLCAGGEDKPSNMQWIEDPDHRFKTLVDVKECRKLKILAGTEAIAPNSASSAVRTGTLADPKCVNVDQDWTLSDKGRLATMPRMDDHKRAHVPPRPLPPPAPPQPGPKTITINATECQTAP